MNVFSPSVIRLDSVRFPCDDVFPLLLIYLRVSDER